MKKREYNNKLNKTLENDNLTKIDAPLELNKTKKTTLKVTTGYVLNRLKNC